jgi:hypothetical protein
LILAICVNLFEQVCLWRWDRVCDLNLETNPDVASVSTATQPSPTSWRVSHTFVLARNDLMPTDFAMRYVQRVDTFALVTCLATGEVLFHTIVTLCQQV